MKKYILILSLLAISCYSAVQAQGKKTIPATIKLGFEKAYPNQKPDWVREKHGYAAKFTEHGNGAVVHFNRHGHQTQRDWYIIHSELPQAAVVYLNKYYAGINFPNILKIENIAGNITYKVRLNRKELVFNEKGIFIKKQKQRG